MAITFVGYATATGADGTYTIDLTSLSAGTLAEDDIVLVANGSVTTGGGDFNMTITTPSGYTMVGDLYGNDTYDSNLGVSYKVQGTTPDTTVTCIGTDSSARSSASVAYVFRGVDTTTPMDVTATTATGVNTGTPDPPSITPTTSGAVTVAVRHGCSVSEQTSAVTSTGYGDQARATYDVGLAATTVVGWKAWTSGAENPDALGTGWSVNSLASWCAATLALRPAAGATGSEDYVEGGTTNDNSVEYPNSTFNTTLTAGVGSVVGSTLINSAVRFPNISIPQGSTIDTASVSGTSTVTNTGIKAKIYAVDEDNHVAATNWTTMSADQGIQTTAAVDWDFDSTSGLTDTSPEIKTVIQEIIDRAGFVPYNAIGLHFMDDGSASGKYCQWKDEFSLTDGLVLHIEWSAPGGGATYLPPPRRQLTTVRM